MNGEPSKMQGFVQSMLDELAKMASTKTIVGDPMKVEDKTVVPVVRVSVGFGVGGGEGTGDMPASKEGKSGKGSGYGQGGGGGIKIDPVAFITIQDGKVTLLPVTRKGAKLDKLVDAVPDLIEKIQAMREKKEEEK